MLHIKVNESHTPESTGFLTGDLKERLRFSLPTLTDANALAVFKCSEDVDADSEMAVYDMSWNVASVAIDGEYLMVAFRDNPGERGAKNVMSNEYRKAILPEALGLVEYLDVEAIRREFASIVAESNGTDWELDYVMGMDDDTPGLIDTAHTGDGSVTFSVDAFGYTASEFVHGREIESATDRKEAVRILKSMVDKYGNKAGA